MADRIVKPDTGNDLVLQNDDASAKIEINEDGSIPVTGTFDVSSATLTTSSAQKQAIVQAGPGSGTLDVSSGTFTTSSAQKDAIVDGSTAISRSGNNLTFAGTVGNTGDNTITSGNLVIGTAGNGITFQDVSHGSPTYSPTINSSANTLNEFEEGDFDAGTTTSSGEGNNQGKYVRIGQLVFCQLYLSWTNGVNNNSSQFRITGLPFTPLSSGYYSGGSLGYVGSANMNDAMPLIGDAINAIYFHQNDGVGTNLLNSEVHTRGFTTCIVSITYYAA